MKDQRRKKRPKGMIQFERKFESQCDSDLAAVVDPMSLKILQQLRVLQGCDRELSLSLLLLLTFDPPKIQVPWRVFLMRFKPGLALEGLISGCGSVGRWRGFFQAVDAILFEDHALDLARQDQIPELAV